MATKTTSQRIGVRWQSIVQVLIAAFIAALIGGVVSGGYAALGMLMIVIPSMAVAYLITWILGLAIKSNADHGEPADG